MMDGRMVVEQLSTYTSRQVDNQMLTSLRAAVCRTNFRIIFPTSHRAISNLGYGVTFNPMC